MILSAIAVGSDTVLGRVENLPGKTAAGFS